MGWRPLLTGGGFCHTFCLAVRPGRTAGGGAGAIGAGDVAAGGHTAALGTGGHDAAADGSGDGITADLTGGHATSGDDGGAAAKVPRADAERGHETEGEDNDGCFHGFLKMSFLYEDRCCLHPAECRAAWVGYRKFLRGR